MRVPGGGGLLPGCGASGVGRSPTSNCPPSGRAAGARYPLDVGAGGCGRGDPSPTPQRALLRAVGAARGCPGGAPPACVWGVWGRALSHPRLPALWAGCRVPLPTGCGCGGVRAWGPVTNPTARTLACFGGGTRVPGGALLAWLWGVRGRALSQPRLPALWAACRGPLPTGCGCWGVLVWGPVTNPTARWLCALWGRHEAARGGRLLPGCGASGVWRSPIPDCPPSGRAAGARYPLAVGAGGCGRGDPSPTPQRALLRAVGAARGCPGGAPPACVWGVWGRALSHPRLPALRAGCRVPLPTGCGRGGVRA